MDSRDFRTEILEAVHIFVSETGMAEGSLSKRACGDSRFVGWLRGGRKETIDRCQQLWSFMVVELRRFRKAAAEAGPGEGDERRSSGEGAGAEGGGACGR